MNFSYLLFWLYFNNSQTHTKCMDNGNNENMKTLQYKCDKIRKCLLEQNMYHPVCNINILS